MEDIKQARMIIVDDQEYNVQLLERILRRAEFKHIYSIMDPLQMSTMLKEVDPDIVLLDMHMPGMDGLQVLQLIREQSEEGSYLPVLMLTADVTPAMKQQGLQAGVNDFLTKPYDRTEVILRINNLLKTRQLHIQLQQHKNTLEDKVRARTEELRRAKLEILQLLGRASEYRDDLTGSHTLRVGRLAGLIASRIGYTEMQVENLRMAAALHDIGKIGIPDHILLKPGRYEPYEFDQMKAHTLIGSSILAASSFSLLRLAGIIARSHHEKWDGSGYPDGLQGEQIPVEARIVALADFYDALTHERPYKKAWSAEETIAEIKRQSGLHFDPALVEVFIQLHQEGEITEGMKSLEEAL
ncbi:HD-GYP domain-containing protein [Paenibacillus sp. YYML68]|uniref:HD-GYP domain-containing protein n=1 Tax=Paenibacillus sp. YYML68 TaxID=2909250 RepID=UPI00248F586C|nr:HD domain-containing phosphohydrolase [Paenibacillus sp. YYML68]